MSLQSFIVRSHLPFRFLHHLISAFIGWAARLTCPSVLAKLAVTLYQKGFKVPLEDVETPLKDFSCVSHFFTRTLKPGARPLGLGLVSPADGTIICEDISDKNSSTITFKGNKSSISSLMGEGSVDPLLSEGDRLLIYLSPRDYHRVHAPEDVVLHKIRFISGTLWPVNSWALQQIEGLFALNERLIFYFKVGQEDLMLIMIGALNVGTISLAPRIAPRAYSRFSSKDRISEWVPESPMLFNKGEWLGTFCLGSSVVLLAPKGNSLSSQIRAANSGIIRYGESFCPSKS